MSGQRGVKYLFLCFLVVMSLMPAVYYFGCTEIQDDRMHGSRHSEKGYDVVGIVNGRIVNGEQHMSFDEQGNLLLVTHDRKATSAVTYKTLGVVIKRYDLPAQAIYQQSVLLPVEVQVTEDIFDNNYVYCYYRVQESVIAEAVKGVSKEWYHDLYACGEYVYIDEVMTIAEHGQLLGGLSESGEVWGEVYFNYEGIAGARPWASKESLRTHFHKKVYFAPRTEKTYFRYEELTVGEERFVHDEGGQLHLHAGTKYRTTYDVEEAVPSGESLCLTGTADSVKYDLVFVKKQVVLYIPVSIVAVYELHWRDAQGVEQYEQKQVTGWYLVKRTADYYSVKKREIKYLTGVSIGNAVLEGGHFDYEMKGNQPLIDSLQYGEYYEHVTLPAYRDEVRVQRGSLTEQERWGVKPSIPEEDFQSVAEQEVGRIQARSDKLVINHRTVLSDTPGEEHGKKPVKAAFGVRRSVFAGGIRIPVDRGNGAGDQTTGCLYYTDLDSKDLYREKIPSMESVTVHTPVYISGAELFQKNNLITAKANLSQQEKMTETAFIGYPFLIETKHFGTHIGKKGYGVRDYSIMTGKEYVRFDCAVFTGEEKKPVEPGTWILFDGQTEFYIPSGTKEGVYEMTILTVAKNCPPESEMREDYTEDTANLDRRHYIAKTTQSFQIRNLVTMPSGVVVGTH